MNAFLALVRKDLHIFFGDRRAVIMAFAAPILIGSFFGYVFGGAPKSSNEQSKMKVLFVDQDHSPTAKDLFTSLRKEATLDVTLPSRPGPCRGWVAARLAPASCRGR